MTQEIKAIEVRFDILEGLKEVEPLAEDSINHITGSLRQLQAYPDLVRERRQIEETIKGLDLSYLDKLDQAIAQVDKQKKEVAKICEQLKTKKIVAENENKNIIEEKIPQQERERDNLRQKIEENYTAEWIQETGERFLKVAKGISIKILRLFLPVGAQPEARRKEMAGTGQCALRLQWDYKMSYDINILTHQQKN